MSSTNLNNSGELKNQVIYVGMDVHKSKWVITISNGSEPITTFSMESDVAQLIKKLLKHYKEYQIVCAYEAGFSGYWIHRILESAGIKCLVVNAADIPTTNKESRRKDDKRDSRKIAHHLSRHSLSSIYIPSQEQERLRGLARFKAEMAKSKRKSMNRIRAGINKTSSKAPAELSGKKLWTKAGEKWITQLAESNQNWELLENLKEYQYKLQRLKDIKKKITALIEESSYEKVFECLQSVPGVGWWTAVVLITELGEINRFKNIDFLASYCGFVPDIEASGEKFRTKGLTKRANRRIRTALVLSSWVAIRFDPLLKNIYHQAIENGKSPQKAIIKIGKKLLSRIRAVWKKETPYYYTAVAA